MKNYTLHRGSIENRSQLTKPSIESRDKKGRFNSSTTTTTVAADNTTIGTTTTVRLPTPPSSWQNKLRDSRGRFLELLLLSRKY